jgi:hypothetical protein
MEDVIAGLTLLIKTDIRIFPRGGPDFFHVELLQNLFPAGRLA